MYFDTLVMNTYFVYCRKANKDSYINRYIKHICQIYKTCTRLLKYAEQHDTIVSYINKVFRAFVLLEYTILNIRNIMAYIKTNFLKASPLHCETNQM